MKSRMLPLMLLSAMLPVGAGMAQLVPPVECRSGGDAYEVVDPLIDAFMKKDHVEAGSFIAEPSACAMWRAASP
jgi:hypothetical protein